MTCDIISPWRSVDTRCRVRTSHIVVCSVIIKVITGSVITPFHKVIHDASVWSQSGSRTTRTWIQKELNCDYCLKDKAGVMQYIRGAIGASLGYRCYIFLIDKQSHEKTALTQLTSSMTTSIQGSAIMIVELKTNNSSSFWSWESDLCFHFPLTWTAATLYSGLSHESVARLHLIQNAAAGVLTGNLITSHSCLFTMAPCWPRFRW